MAFIYYVTQIQFDFGAVSLLKAECQRIGITKPLIVTDPGVNAAGVLHKALNATGPPAPRGVRPDPVQPDRSRRTRRHRDLQGSKAATA